MTEPQLLIVFVAGLLGLAAFLWKWAVSVLASLKIGIESLNEIQTDDTTVAILTVENDTGIPRKIKFAALLVFPSYSSVQMTSKLIGSESQLEMSEYLQTLLNQKPATQRYDANDGTAILPVPFLYQEQEQVGNGSLTCPVFIDKSKFRNSGLYEARFIVFIGGVLGVTRCRMVSSALQIELKE